MKKRALLMMAVCAVLFSAAPVFAAAGTCADWAGTWTFAYKDGTTDTVVIDTPCSQKSCYPDILKSKAMLTCYAAGKRQSNNQAVEIMELGTIPDAKGTYGYYEATDLSKLDQSSPYDDIKASDFTACSFTAAKTHAVFNKNPLNILNYGFKPPCSAPTTTTTAAAGGCPAQKVLGEDNAALDNLRTFRDGSLAQSAVGRVIIQIYYNNADSINAALDSSPALQSVAQGFFKAAAALGGNQ